jgi:phosphoglycolate phosphatase
VHGVIFDLDGTLADTLDDIAASLNHALQSLGLPPQPREAVALMVGDGALMLTKRALGEEHGDLLESALALFADHYRQHALDSTRLFPGVAEQLDRLSRAGWRFGMLSNKPHEFTLQCADALLARWRFSSVRGAVPGVPHKPDPAAALLIASDLATSPDRVYFVGDSPGDIVTGRAAGMCTVGVSWGYRSRELLAQQEPDLLIHHPVELASAMLQHAQTPRRRPLK